MAPTTAPAKRRRGEGQWALGHLEPLNPNERFKKDDDGLNVRARIENIYSKRGFASIDPADLRGRFRWWGLYTQRRPGIPGGRTAVLEPHELDDEFFMLRIRIDGGQLTTDQLRVIADVSTTYARDTADVTDRQNVQLHWIRVEDVPEIWQRLEAVGLSTTEACGDTPRVVLGSPVAGIAAAEVIDASWAVEEVQRRYVGSPGVLQPAAEVQDGHQRIAPTWCTRRTTSRSSVSSTPSTVPGSTCGSGAGCPPIRSSRSGSAPGCRSADVPEVWAGVVGIFRDYGYRRLRTKARLKFLVADWGAERFRAVLETDYLGRRLADGPSPLIPPQPYDHIGVHRQNDGRFYVGVAPLVGRVSGTVLRKLADTAEAARLDAAAHHAVPEAGDPRRRVGPGRGAGQGLGRPGTLGSAQPVPPLHDGVHRPGVLQARDRRDEGGRGRDGGRAGKPPGRRRRPARHPDHAQRQRLPQLVRPNPGGGHRPQGPDRARIRTGFRYTSAVASGSMPASGASCAA